MEKQKVVFVNATDCSNTEKTQIVVNEILGTKPELSNPVVDLYCWNADTKYYTADIRIAILKTKSLVNEEFASGIEAALLYFDVDTDQEFTGLQSWLPYINAWNPSIKLAVCERCGRENSAMSRTAVQKWCLDNSFELVELKPDPEDYNEFEATGINRVKGALLAHIWPEITMKDSKSGKWGNCSTTDVQLVQKPQELVDKLLGKESEYDDIIGNENEQDDFEKLFSKLASMKDHVSSMPHEERKKQAENMVRAFWTALGGDDDEFAGLSSDDDDIEKASGS